MFLFPRRKAPPWVRHGAFPSVVTSPISQLLSYGPTHHSRRPAHGTAPCRTAPTVTPAPHQKVKRPRASLESPDGKLLPSEPPPQRTHLNSIPPPSLPTREPPPKDGGGQPGPPPPPMAENPRLVWSPVPSTARPLLAGWMFSVLADACQVGCTLHRAPVGQGPSVPDWLATLPLGFGLGGCLLLARRGQCPKRLAIFTRTTRTTRAKRQ